MVLRPSIRIALGFGAALLGVAATGCSRKASDSKPVETATSAANSEAPIVAASDEKPTEPLIPGVHGVNKKLVHPVAVTLDGEPIGVLRPGELPPSLEMRDNAREGQKTVRYYRFAEYLEKLGVSLASVKTIHLAGHRDHVASIEGSELRAEPTRFVFDFGHMMSAMPKSCWATDGMKNQLRIDTIRNVAIYSKKAAPVLDKTLHCYSDDGKHCLPAYDATGKTAAKGTRIYVDGKLAGYVKRRLASDEMIVSPAGETTNAKYSLSKFLGGLKIDGQTIQGAEFLSGDDVLARASADVFKRGTDVAFEIPKHSHGRIVATLPQALQSEGAAADKTTPISAIQIFKKNGLTHRPLRAITEQDVASASQGGSQQQDGVGSDGLGDEES